MQNSLVLHLRGYVIAMFKDIAFTYRQEHERKRDETRLLHELEMNGPRVLTVDLPALSKHLDKCLAEGLYTPSRLPYGSLGRRVQVPVLLRDLYLQIFSENGEILGEPSINAVAALRQLLLGCKKIKLPCPMKGLVDEVNSFDKVELGIRRASLNWECDELNVTGADALHFADLLPPHADPIEDVGARSRILQSVSDRISASFGDLSLESPEDLPRHGPGVVADLTKSDSKFAFRDWPRKLDLVFPYDRYGCSDLGASKISDGELPYRNREVPSRLIAVPKDLTKPRLIAAEPSQHQWIQQLVWTQLESRLRHTVLRHSVSFRDQGANQRRALEGSRTGGFATIDLSAASDRLSCAVVERFFRSNPTILERLHACRTRWLRCDIPGVPGFYLALKKFAPMGSAVTFPVQSIVYAGVAISSVILSRGWKLTSANITKAAKLVTVFGDDIIVPTDTCRTTIELLTELGLKVNVNKTYLKGNFRESCGIEAFKGLDVTPARVLIPSDRASAGTLSSLIQTSNNFWIKGWWNTALWVESTFSHLLGFIPIVGRESTFLGRVSFCGSSVGHLKVRESSTLHRMEVRAMIPRNRNQLLPTEGYYRLFQYFTEMPAPDLVNWESGTIGKKVSDMRPGWVFIGNIGQTCEGFDHQWKTRD
jgi:hypothetical protein